MNPILLFTYYRNIVAAERPWILGAWYFFTFTAVAGFILAFQFSGALPRIIEALQQIVGDNPVLGWGLVWTIFRQNLEVCLIALFGGIVFGLAPLGILLTNGVLLGYVLGAFPRLIPTSFLNQVLFAILAIVPHGVVELPLIILSAAFGLRLGFRYTRAEFRGMRLRVVKDDVLTNIKLLPLLACGLLLAAIIEVFLTGNLLEWFAGLL